MIRKTAFVVLAGIFCVSVALAADSEMDKAKTLMKIGDYAGAVGKLHALVQTDPINAEARVLMARCFAESRPKLDVPATVSPGSNNDERAIYQLTILTKLEKPGEAALIDAIRNGGAKLALLAIRVAGQSKIAGAVDAIVAAGSAEKVDADLQAEAAWALVQMKSERAAPPVKAALDRLGQDHPLRKTLAAGYLEMLDAKGRLELARTTETPALLEVFSAKDPGFWPADIAEALVKRKTLPAAVRTKAVLQLSKAKDFDAGKQLPTLVEAIDLGDLASGTSWEATKVVGGLAPEKAVPVLIAYLKSGPHWEEALTRLEEMKGGQGLEPLMKVLADKCEPEAR